MSPATATTAAPAADAADADARPPVLEIDALKVFYGGNCAVDIEHLTVRERELVGVVGANGAGKSSLVNAVLGWSRGHARVSGTVKIDGVDVTTHPTHRRVKEGLLLIPESKLIFSTMSVDENLAPHADVAPETGRKAYTIEDVFNLFPRLKERRNHLGGNLSGGERQMLGIARALRLAPRVLLLDEPSIGLAPRLVSTVLETIGSLTADGLTVLLVEQNVKAAIRVVNRLVLIERGRIVVEGPTAEMQDDPRIAEAYLGEQKG